MGEFLQNRLQNYHPIIDIIPARKKGTEFSPDTESILEPLYQTDMIFMGPGSPTYAARQLGGSLVYEIIKARQRPGQPWCWQAQPLLPLAARHYRFMKFTKLESIYTGSPD